MTTLQTFQMSGWYETNSEGISTIYLAITDEGMTTGPGDTPANTQFKPRVLNAEQFSIKRAPKVWPYGDTTEHQGAAFGQLQIDNYDGAFDFLISADLRDTSVVIRLPAAGGLLTGTTMSSAPLIATGILDSVSSDSEDVVTVNFKDTIARLDKPLPCRFNPPFVDANAANAMVPMSFGAFRNVAPLLVDSANRLYQIHDVHVANISLVSDKAAPLDPSASPPQYTPALSNSGIQLATLPVGKLTCEGSSVGMQSAIPGVNDILAGAGAFPGVIGTPGGWTGAKRGVSRPTTGAVTVVLAGAAYAFPVATTSGFTVGDFVYITDGVNSVYGQIPSFGGTTVVRVTLATAVTTGTPTSIAVGSTVYIPGAPAGFAFSANTGGSISEVVNPPNGYLGSANGAVLTSATVFNPSGSNYGDQLSTATAILQPGVTYRLTFSFFTNVSCPAYFTGGMQGGLMVATALSTNSLDYITGITTPLTAPTFQSQNYALEFTIPAGAARKLYFLAVPSAGNAPNNANGTTAVTLFNVKIEQLGQFVAQPLSAISMTDYFTEILVNRAGEASTIFSSTDTNALAVRDVAVTDTTVTPNITYAAGTLIPFGCHFDQPPNILDALRMALDSFCACLFTDNTGTLRAKRLTDPSNPIGRTIKCAFTTDNMQRPITVQGDGATNITTLLGARRNWSQSSDSDFVTDQAIVSQDRKARYMRPSQYQVTSSQTPAGQYSFAIGAPIFDSVIDIPNDAQVEIDRVVGIWSPTIYSDGTTATGKRRIVKFTAFWDDPNAIGIGTTCAVTAIGFGDIVSLTYASHGFSATPGAVLAWEIFPFAQKIILTVLV